MNYGIYTEVGSSKKERKVRQNHATATLSYVPSSILPRKNTSLLKESPRRVQRSASSKDPDSEDVIDYFYFFKATAFMKTNTENRRETIQAQIA